MPDPSHTNDRPRARRELISGRDLLQAVTLLMMVPVALIVPKSRWPENCRMMSRFGANFRISQVSKIAATLAAFRQSEETAVDSMDSYCRCLEMYWENRLQIVDQNLRKRWHPKIGLTGENHLNSALDARRGAILWVSPFAFSDLVVKIGLAQADYKIAHLSRPEHGYSETRVGMATLNRLRTRIEDRYLHKRVPIDVKTEQRATLALRRIVKNNGIVSITVGSQTRSADRVSLGHGELQIATGAIRLAQMTKAPLIPVFGVKRADLDYHVYIESPIELADKDTESARRQYAGILEQYIRRYPFQWRGTSDFTPGREPENLL